MKESLLNKITSVIDHDDYMTVEQFLDYTDQMSYWNDIDEHLYIDVLESCGWEYTYNYDDDTISITINDGKTLKNYKFNSFDSMWESFKKYVYENS